jgi:hypothetical protein
MSEAQIRAMRRDEVEQAALLYRFVDRSDWRIPPAEVPRWLERTLFDQPWADPEIPSLVYEDEHGEILGFIGSHVRRMRFDGEPVRLAAGGPLIAHPKVRNRAVGAMLWRRYMAGPQDLTITDGASNEMRLIFERIGGQMMHPANMTWLRVYRPWCYLGNRLLHRNVWVRHRVKPLARRALPALDGPTTRAIPYFRPPHAGGCSDELLTPALVLEHLPALTRSLRLVPDYDEPFLEWVFAELHNNRTWGSPQRRLVRGEDGRVLGWYVYFLKPDESCQVLHLAAHSRHTGAVLDNLFAHAIVNGGAAIQGRVEAHILAELGARNAMFRFSARSLVHSRNAELLGALTSGHALLTRLEGEWWMAT